jgi:hypothetical protein
LASQNDQESPVTESAAISSTDADHWWGASGPCEQLDLSSSDPEVRKLVLGDLGSALTLTADHLEVLRDISQHFPELTNLHLWGVANLQSVGGLPASLKCLDIRRCPELQEIQALPIDAKLQTLDLGECASLSELPSADHSQLTHAWLNGCHAIRQFAPLQSALKSLQHLELHGCHFQDLSADLCGVPDENVAAKIRQHFLAVEHQGTEPLAECKIIVLGNGGVGKTELVRALQGHLFDPDQSSTHGIRLWKWNGTTPGHKYVPFPEHDDTELDLNIWDFGGQDLYHNTHRLFMETQAVFVIVERYPRANAPLRPEHPDDIVRPLDYWLDQVYAATKGAGKAPRVVLVRSAIDDTANVQELPHWKTRVRPEYQHLSYFELSSRDEQRNTEPWQEFRGQLQQFVTEELGGWDAVLQPRGRVAVRRELAKSQPAWNENVDMTIAAGPLLKKHEFRSLVEQVFQQLDIPAPDDDEIRWQLDFFHQRGVVYAPTDWIAGAVSPDAYPVIVDQRWIIEGIYELIRPGSPSRDDLNQCRGRVTRPDLWAAWDELQLEKPHLQYSEDARLAMLAYMESSGLMIVQEDEWILPEFLPDHDRMLKWHAGDPLVQQRSRQPFGSFHLRDRSLGLGFGCQLMQWLVRTFGSKIPLYRYGAIGEIRVGNEYTGGSESVPVEIAWQKQSEDHFAGDLLVALPSNCQHTSDILNDLHQRLVQERLLPEGTRFQALTGEFVLNRPAMLRLDQQSMPHRGRIRPHVRLGLIGISMAGGAAGSELEFWPELIHSMLEVSDIRSFDVLRYRRDTDRPSIQKLNTDLAGSDILMVIVSNKYLFSEYCMVELLLAARKWSHSANEAERSQPGFLGDHDEWLEHVRFFILPDAEWILAKEETGEVQKWKSHWRTRGADYLHDISGQFEGDEPAKIEAPKVYAFDAWMRFAAQASTYPERLRAAIRNSRSRHSLQQLPAGFSTAELNDWGRQEIRNSMTQLQSMIADTIRELTREQKIERLVERAIKNFKEQRVERACGLFDECLKLLPDFRRVHDELLKPEAAIQNIALQPLTPILPAWRKRQGK